MLRSGHGDSGSDFELVALGLSGPHGWQCAVDVAVWLGDLSDADCFSGDGLGWRVELRLADSVAALVRVTSANLGWESIAPRRRIG